MSTSTPFSLVFIDACVSDYAQLMAHLPSTAEVVVLDSATDGLQQMADYLAGRTGIEAIHVVSHGSQGALHLGNTRVDGDYLTGHSAQLASIGSSLTESGDILLYGCNVAQGDVGLQFVQSLAELTGADVAASSNATGTVVFGGDVVLEQSSGSVQATALTLEGLSGVLGVNTAPGFTAGDGKVITDFGSPAYGQSIVLQTDGKILVAGFNNSYDFALARYNADGSLDIRFSIGGKLTTDFLLSTDQGHSVTLQADGKILVAGSSGNYYKSYDFALARYNADGSLDASFSGDGKLTTDFVGYDDISYSVTVQADGKILAAGSSVNNGLALVRYNVEGSLDTSFSGDGKLTTNFGSSSEGRSVALQADGRILVAGSSGNDFALARYNADGSLDTSFSGDGLLTTDFGSFDYGNSVALQADGKILVAGSSYSYSSHYDFALARYNADGSLDTSFSDDGKLTTDFGSSDSGNSVTLQADGKILVAGSIAYGSVALARYNADGSLDSSFSGDGMLTTNFGLSASVQSVTLQADGKILVAGNSDGDFALARYNADGSPDNGFGSTLNATPIYTGSSPVALDANARVWDNELALANNYYGSTLTLTRHGGANASDEFSALTGGNLSTLIAGGYFSVNGTSIGRVLSNANGTLKLGFTTGATQELVNQTLQQIAYANTASTPPARVQIDWTFSDGNTGTQGTGGAMSVTGSTTVQITAGNSAPIVNISLPDMHIRPDQVFEFTLPAGTFSDANTGEPFTYKLAMADNTALPSWLTFNGTTGTFRGTPGIFDMGTFDLRVTAIDTAGATVSDEFLLEVNSNTAPTGTLAATGNPTQGQTLTIDNTLADADGLGQISYQWLANGQTIGGATNSSLILGQAQVGKTISVTASYTDAQGTAESVTSGETAVVANVNDAPTGTVTLTGTAAQNQTLTVTDNLADVDGMGTVSYQWLANGAALEGAIGTSLTLNQALVGKTISVQARYTDGFGTEEAKTSRVTAAVTNVNDAPTGNVTISGTATQGQTLTASNTLADADGLGVLKYQWLANGVAIAGATGSSLTLAQAQVGKVIRVQVKYTDGFGTQQTVQSTATEVVANTNDAPTFSNLPVASQPVLTGYASALNDFKVADLDGGTLHLTVQANNGTVKGLVDVDTSTDGIQLSGSAASLNKALAAATFVAADIGPASLALTLSDGTALPVTATYAMQAGFKVTNGDAADNTLSGGAGMDQLAGNDGNDNLNGGGGKDKLLGGNGNDTLNGGTGVDTMTGGLGDDTYYVDAAGDVVNESNDAANGGTDTVFSSVTRTLGAFQENLTLTGAAALNGTGNTLNNMLTGNAGANKLTGNAGNDVLTGGMGKDVLSGGAGADTFVFNAAAESTGTTKDTILDFVAGTDQIDLRGIDANTLTTGSNEAFTFIGKAAFSSTNATGQLRFSYSAAGNFVVVSGSTDADVEAEFSVQLNGISTLSAADFLL